LYVASPTLLLEKTNTGETTRHDTGMSTASFTLLHVIISLIGILTGLVVAAGLWKGKRLDGWTGAFLLTTVLTSVTGFMFPGTGLDPARVVSILSLVMLAIAILAFYGYHVAGAWRWIR